MLILKKSAKKLKSILFFPLMTIFYNSAYKVKTNWVKKVVKLIWKLEMPMLLCMFGLFVLEIKHGVQKIIILNTQNLQ